jgi:hypothetical protein
MIILFFILLIVILARLLLSVGKGEREEREEKGNLL